MSELTDPLSDDSTPSILAKVSRRMHSNIPRKGDHYEWAIFGYAESGAAPPSAVIHFSEVYRDPAAGLDPPRLFNDGFPIFEDWAGLLESNAGFPSSLPHWAPKYAEESTLPLLSGNPADPLNVVSYNQSGGVIYPHNDEASHLIQERLWLRGPIAPPGGITKTVIIRKETLRVRPCTTADCTVPEIKSSDISFESFTFTVPPGERVSSNHFDMVPTFIHEEETPAAERHFQKVRWTPIPLEVVRGDPAAEEVTHADRLVEEAKPTPEVILNIGNVSLNGDSIQVAVSGLVTDPLSRLSRNPSDAPPALVFSALGEDVGNLPLNAQVAQGQSFSTTLSVPLTHDGSFILRAKTAPNSAGLSGFDQAAVSIHWQQNTAAINIPGSSLTLVLPQTPAAGITDSLQISETGGSLQILTETGLNTGIYSGTVTLGGASASCTVQIARTLTLGNTTADLLSAEIHLQRTGGAQNRMLGLWRETGPTTKTFSNPGMLSQGTAVASAGQVTELRGTPQGGAVPFTIRLADSSLPEGARVLVGGVEFPLKSFTFGNKTALYPYSPAQPGSPRLFLPSRYSLPASLAVPGFTSTSEGSPMEVGLKLSATQTVPVAMLYSVPEAQDEEPEPPAAAAARWTEPGDEITMQELLAAFSILYGDEGQALLAKFNAAGGTIELVNEVGDLDVSFWLRDNYAPLIEIEKNDSEVGDQKYTPAGAAHLLWRGLYESLASPAMAQQLGTEDFEWWLAHQQEFANSAAEITVGATELYLSGIGLFSESADLILSVNEALSGHSEALIAALPFVSVGIVKHLRRTNGTLRVYHPQTGSIAEMTDQQLAGFAEISYYGDKINGAAEIDFGLLGPKLREWLTAPGGKIDPEEIGSYGKLRQEFEKISPAPSTNHHCHHDLPWNLRDKFAGFGVDVNDPLFGRWITMERHSQMHLNEGYNAWWETWISSLNGRVPSRAEILHQISLAHEAFPD